MKMRMNWYFEYLPYLQIHMMNIRQTTNAPNYILVKKEIAINLLGDLVFVSFIMTIQTPYIKKTVFVWNSIFLKSDLRVTKWS